MAKITDLLKIATLILLTLLVLEARERGLSSWWVLLAPVAFAMWLMWEALVELHRVPDEGER